MPTSDVIVPRNDTEALIDLRIRYARCVRMVWTLLGVTLMLSTSLFLVAWSVDNLADDLRTQRNIAEANERQRRIDRAEQRYAICQRPPEQRPAAPLCDGYESLESAYEAERVAP